MIYMGMPRTILEIVNWSPIFKIVFVLIILLKLNNVYIFVKKNFASPLPQFPNWSNSGRATVVAHAAFLARALSSRIG
jgi:hypothetical protein